MARALIEIKHTIPPEELESLLCSVGKDELGARFVHVAHDPDATEDTNLILMARKDPVARRCLVELAKRGYYPYLTKEGATRLVRSDRVDGLWVKITENEYKITPDEVVYFIEPPLEEKPPIRLLVVFSAIHQNPSGTGLQRYFMQNYPSVQKYMPPGTAVLRVGDLGGVVGAFYLNTNHRPRNADAIRNLIESVRADLGVTRDAVVLYGVSKGATGAVYHGLTAGHRFVAVDPILADEHYLVRYNDPHFTEGGVFPERKEKTFERLLDRVATEGAPAPMKGRCAVICSERSPQFLPITRMLVSRFSDSMSFFNSRDPLIRDHPDVGPRTVNCATMLMSMQLYGLPVPTGMHTID